jgi:HlyD family secretion protein
VTDTSPRPTGRLRTKGRVIAALAVLAAALGAGVMRYATMQADVAITATVQRGTLTARLTTAGILRAAQAIMYRSPIPGREIEITFLVAEGTRVNEGDLLFRLDTVELERELERANQELRQAIVDLQVADIERQEAQAAIDSLAEGEAALAVDETKTRLQLADKKVARLRQEHDSLQPLMEKGFVTRDELRRIADELEQAEEELGLTRRRAEVLIDRTHPRDRQRAELQLAQRDAQRENVRARLQEAQVRVKRLQQQLDGSSVYASQPGLVVYEEYLASSPRRKIRVGDRVTESQGLVTIPEVGRMVVEATVSEADIQRVQRDQAATIILEAFRERPLSGKVARVGTLARMSAERPLEDKRFDLIVALDSSDLDVRPEMTARVDILLAERPGVLLLPVNAIFNQNGMPVVHVVGRFGIETRPVQLGETGEAFVEVVAGVSEGDRVTLTEVDGLAPVPPAARGGTAGGSAVRRLSTEGNTLAPR